MKNNGQFKIGNSPWNKGIHTIGTPHTEEAKNKMRLAKLGELNPAKRKEVREKISISLKGRFVGENNWNYGKTPSKETIQKIMNSDGWKKACFKKGHVCYTQRKEVREKIAKTLTGRVLSEERKKAIANGVSKHWKEKGYPEEGRKKLSLIKTGKPLSDAHKRKMSESRKGFRHSEESKKRMSVVFKGRKVSDKTRERISIALLGEKHFNWKGGKSFKPYCPKFNNKLRKRIREKYGNKCFLCGVPETESKRKLHVHHIEYDKKQGCGGKDFNLIPLCHSCHSKTNFKRDYYNELFTELINKHTSINILEV